MVWDQFDVDRHVNLRSGVAPIVLKISKLSWCGRRQNVVGDRKKRGRRPSLGCVETIVDIGICSPKQSGQIMSATPTGSRIRNAPTWGGGGQRPRLYHRFPIVSIGLLCWPA